MFENAFIRSLRKKLLFSSFLILLIPMLWRCGRGNRIIDLDPEEKTWLREHNGKIRLGTEYYYDLFNPDDEGIYNGISSDYIKLIEKKLNFQFRIVPIENWFEENQKVAEREVDVLTSLAGTTRFSRYMLFTDPYLEFPAYLVVRENPGGAVDSGFFKGKGVTYLENDDAKKFLLRHFDGARICQVNDPIQALLDLSGEKTDAVVLSKVMATFYMKKANISNLHIIGPIQYKFKTSIASRNDWPILHRILNKGLAMITASEKEAVLKRWGMKKYFWNSSRFWVIFLALFLVVLFTISAVLIWNRTLRKKVREQTMEIRRELSERIRMENESKKQQEQLFQADKMISLGILLSGMAHEINNPNNAIGLNAELLRDAWKSIAPILDEYHSVNPQAAIGGFEIQEAQSAIPLAIASLARNSQRIQEIVNSLKDFSRKESESEKGPVNLNLTVADAVHLLQGMIQKKTRFLEIDLDETIPLIHGNRQKIEQMVINLVQNACLALPDPERKIEIKTGRDAESKRVWLIVRDKGTGIAEEDLKYIQEPFFTTRRAEGGVGLGLFIVKKIVDDHEGNISFESSPGGGTTVSVSFPAPGSGEQ